MCQERASGEGPVFLNYGVTPHSRLRSSFKLIRVTSDRDGLRITLGPCRAGSNDNWTTSESIFVTLRLSKN